MAERALTYSSAGVDIATADRLNECIRRLAKKTFNRNVLTGIGSFGAVYSLTGKKLKKPVLVSSVDGVGTKLKIAFAMAKHDTVGQCLVNHCVNDIAVQGASPLFFLDYISTGKLELQVAKQVLQGISRACRRNGLALIGGETAEMPGMYNPGEYDLAGFIVGAAERKDLLLGSKVKAGSELLAFPSSGLHTNGYSLARKIFFQEACYKIDSSVPGLHGTIGDELLKVHRSYLAQLKVLTKAGLLLAAAHITGGGITDNTPRMIKDGLQARIFLQSWNSPAVFQILQRLGKIEELEMLRTFNMGAGMIVCIPQDSTGKAIELLRKNKHRAFRIGHVEKGNGGVVYQS